MAFLGLVGGAVGGGGRVGDFRLGGLGGFIGRVSWGGGGLVTSKWLGEKDELFFLFFGRFDEDWGHETALGFGVFCKQLPSNSTEMGELGTQKIQQQAQRKKQEKGSSRQFEV